MYDNLGQYELSFLERLSSSQRVLYQRFHCIVVKTVLINLSSSLGQVPLYLTPILAPITPHPLFSQLTSSPLGLPVP